MSGAAIFDLDRTLLQGGTGPLLSRAMFDLGVVTRKLPGEGLLYGMFDLIGETLPSIFLARQATLLAKGRDGATFDAAALGRRRDDRGRHPPVRAHAHRAAPGGRRPVVLATTTPHHLIKPLADKLGFDHVIATRYTINEEGRFDGSISGNFVWSRGKLAAVKEWAAPRGCRPRRELRLLRLDLRPAAAVGRRQPRRGQPGPAAGPLRGGARLADRALRRLAGRAQGAGARRRAAAAALPRQPAGVLALRPLRRRRHRAHPAHRPAILVGNHRSYFDIAGDDPDDAPHQPHRPHPRQARAVRRARRRARSRRRSAASRSTAAAAGAESFEHAAVALEGGELVCLLPQGTIPRGEKFFDPVLKGRTGAARLAAMTGAPVIPFGVWGPSTCGRARNRCPGCSTSPTRRPCGCGSARRSS